ncbi:MAG: DNA polymerase sliding clamp [Methanosarcinales archaeon]
MIKFVLDGRILKQFVNCCSVISNEGLLRISSDKWRSIISDPANVSMIDITLNNDAFEVYEFEKEGEEESEEIRLGIDLNKLADLLKMAEKEDSVELTLKNGNKMNLQIKELKYSVLLLDPDVIKKENDPPQLDPPAQVIITGSEFNRACKAAEKVSKYISLGVEEDSEGGGPPLFYMEAKGDADSVRLEINRDYLIGMKASTVRSLFSLEYLDQINKAYSKNSEITLDLGNDYPLRLTFEIADGFGECVYYLAPRIENYE